MKHKKSKRKKESFIEKHKNNIIFATGVIIFLLIAFFLFIPTKTVTYEVEVSYTDIEAYYEKEPYNDQEAYQSQEPYETTEYYTDTVPVEKSVPYTDYETRVVNAPPGTYYPDYGSCSCTDYNFWGGCIQLTCLEPVTKYKTEIVYEEITKERPVTKYETVTKYRTVTKYKDVEKTREVIKTRMETKRMEVNWIWGFKMPFKLHLS